MRVSRRIVINLIAFAAVFVAFVIWGALNVVDLQIIKRPYTVTAEFSSTPGIRANFEVAYLGVPVGDVGSVRLARDRVVASLRLNHGVNLPASVTASVLRMSAVGEPYVELAPAGGADPGGPRLRRGSVIPVSRTSAAPDYSQLFVAVGNLIDAVPPADLGQLIHSLSVGWGGTSDQLRGIFTDVDRLTSSLAANAPLLNQLVGDITQLTHTVAGHSGAIGQGWDNLASLSQVLEQKKGAIAALLDRSPTLAGQVDSLLSRSGPSIGCEFDSAAAIFRALTPDQLQHLADVFHSAPLAAKVLIQSIYHGPDGPYLTSSLTLTLQYLLNAVSITPTVNYNPPRQLPGPPVVTACSAGAFAGTGGSPAGAAAGGGSAPLAGSDLVSTPGRPAALPPAVAASSRKDGPGNRLLDRLRWFALAGVVVAGAAVVVQALRKVVR